MSRQRLYAWLPGVLVLGVGLGAWLAAMNDADALAARVHSACVVVSFVATLMSWLRVRRIAGFVIAGLLKLGAVLALAPGGFRALVASYEQIRNYAYAQDYLVYFWALPPLLSVITLAEGWLIAVHASGRTFDGTWPWIHRRRLAPMLALGTFFAVAWWLGRTEYYLWRMRAHGHAPSGYSLAKVGPRALPRIYREIHELGDRPAPGYRADLVDAISDIRYEVLARRIGSPLVWEVQATLVEVEPAMLAAVRAALLTEPDPEEQRTITIWAGDLDFNTQVALFCSVFAQVPEASLVDLIRMIDSPLRWASETYRASERPPRHEPSYPWGDLGQSEIEERQRRMRDALGCVTPLLVDALEKQAPGWTDDALPAHADLAVRGLGRLAPWPAEIRNRLANLLPKLQSGYLLTRMLDVFADELVRAHPGGRRAWHVSLYRSLRQERTRRRALGWIADRPGADLFFCDTFPQTSAAERSAHIDFLHALPRVDACVIELLKRESEGSSFEARSAERELERRGRQ